MFWRAAKRNKTDKTNAVCALGILCIAGLLGSLSTQTQLPPIQKQTPLAVQETVNLKTLQKNLPSRFRAERDPCANPIISCTIVSPSDFGYDREQIYRLPSKPSRTVLSTSRVLRNPMANPLLKDSGSAS